MDFTFTKLEEEVQIFVTSINPFSSSGVYILQKPLKR